MQDLLWFYAKKNVDIAENGKPETVCLTARQALY